MSILKKKGRFPLVPVGTDGSTVAANKAVRGVQQYRRKGGYHDNKTR